MNANAESEVEGGERTQVRAGSMPPVEGTSEFGELHAGSAMLTA